MPLNPYNETYRKYQYSLNGSTVQIHGRENGIKYNIVNHMIAGNANMLILITNYRNMSAFPTMS